MFPFLLFLNVLIFTFSLCSHFYFFCIFTFLLFLNLPIFYFFCIFPFFTFSVSSPFYFFCIFPFLHFLYTYFFWIFPFLLFLYLPILFLSSYTFFSSNILSNISPFTHRLCTLLFLPDFNLLPLCFFLLHSHQTKIHFTYDWNIIGSNNNSSYWSSIKS